MRKVKVYPIDEFTLLGLNQGRTIKAPSRTRIVLKGLCFLIMCFVIGIVLGLVAGLIHDWRIS